MLFSKKGTLFILAFLLVLSVWGNVYILSEQGTVRETYEKKLKELNQKMVQMEKEKSDLIKQVALFHDSPTSVVQQDEATLETDGYQERIKEEKINAAIRFMEFSFNMTPENYAEQKKLAKQYMTNDLYETIYSADGVSDSGKKVSLTLEKSEVYLKEPDGSEAIIYYTMKTNIKETGYSEVISDYAKVSVVKEDSIWKIGSITSMPWREGDLR